MSVFRVLIQPSDYDASVSFFRDVLELPVVGSWTDDGLGTILQAPGGGQIELFGRSGSEDPDPGDRPHRPAKIDDVFDIGLFWEVDDVDAVERDLVDRGVEVVSAAQDRPWGMRSLTIRGPDGMLITLATVLAHD